MTLKGRLPETQEIDLHPHQNQNIRELKCNIVQTSPLLPQFGEGQRREGIYRKNDGKPTNVVGMPRMLEQKRPMFGTQPEQRAQGNRSHQQGVES